MNAPITTYAISADKMGRFAIRATTTIDGKNYSSQIDVGEQVMIGAAMHQIRAVQASYLGKQLVDR